MAKFTIVKGHIVELPSESESKSKPEEKPKVRKKSTVGFNDKETRDFYWAFVSKFEVVMGYKYPGDQYKDCSSIYSFNHNTQYNLEFLQEMIDFVLLEHNGYWEGKPLSINLLCYGRTHYDIIDIVQKRKQLQELNAPDLGDFL